MTTEQWKLVQDIDDKCEGRIIGKIHFEYDDPDRATSQQADAIAFRLLRESDAKDSTAILYMQLPPTFDRVLALAARVLLGGTT